MAVGLAQGSHCFLFDTNPMPPPSIAPPNIGRCKRFPAALHATPVHRACRSPQRPPLSRHDNADTAVFLTGCNTRIVHF